MRPEQRYAINCSMKVSVNGLAAIESAFPPSFQGTPLASWASELELVALGMKRGLRGALGQARGKHCPCNPLETFHRNGLSHHSLSDQLPRQNRILDNAQIEPPCSVKQA